MGIRKRLAYHEESGMNPYLTGEQIRLRHNLTIEEWGWLYLTTMNRLRGEGLSAAQAEARVGPEIVKRLEDERNNLNLREYHEVGS